MQKVILAYCAENQAVASKISYALRSKIEVDHVAFNPELPFRALDAKTRGNDAPVLLLISDNFLKSESCMNEALGIVQNLGNGKRLLPVTTEGVYQRGGAIETVPTSFDRVSNVIQYMNFWQDRYLELRKTANDDASNEKVRIVRTISSEVGELLRYLRTMEFFSFDQFEDSNYVILYRVLGLDENTSFAQRTEKPQEVPQFAEKTPNGAYHDNYTAKTETPAYERTAVEQPRIEVPIPPVVEEVVAKSVLTPEAPAADNDLGQSMPNFQERANDLINDGLDVPTSLEALIENLKNEHLSPANKTEKTPDVSANLSKVIDEIVSENSDALAAVKAKAELAQPVAIESIFDEKITTPTAEKSAPVETTTPQYAEQKTEPKAEAKTETTPAAAEQDLAKSVGAEVSRLFNEAEKTETHFDFEKLNLNVEVPDEIITEEQEKARLIEKAKAEANDELRLHALAVANEPTNSMFRYQYAAALAAHNRIDDASEQLETLLEYDRKNVDAYILLAYLAEQNGDYLLALSCLEKVTLLSPEYPGIFYKLGMLTKEHFKGQKRKALKYFREAIVHDETNSDAHYQVAMLEWAQNGDLAEIIEHLEKADAHQADHPKVAFQLAKAYVEVGKRAEGFNYYQKAVEIDPSVKSTANDEFFRYDPESELTNDNGKVVLITGATSGIGRATADIFAKNGYRVILTGRRADRLEAQKSHYEKEFKNKVRVLNFDVRRLDAVKSAFTSLDEEWKHVDILINNAGLASGLAPIHEGDVEDWDLMIDTNIKGLLYMTRAVAPAMVARRKGHIINICSIAGKDVYPNGNVYHASKFAVDALTRAMRVDLHKYNIRVGQVAPGAVEETEFALVRFHGDTDKAKIYEDFTPLKASDVAETIYFMVTRPEYVNIQDVLMMSTQQASANHLDRSGRTDR